MAAFAKYETAVIEALDRCGYLLASIAGGNHRSLAHAGDAARQALAALRAAEADPEWSELVSE